jgi:hypothetical protein
MAQTTYSLEPAVGVHGQEYDSGFNDHISAVATEDIPMGSFVVRTGGAHDKCKLPASAADITNPGSILGIAVYDSTHPQDATATVATYKSGSRVQILHVGRVRVKFDGTVANGAALYVRHAGTGTRGGVRGDADTANAALLAGANAYIGAAGGAMGVIEINRRGV